MRRRARPELERAARGEFSERAEHPPVELDEGAVGLPVVGRGAAYLRGELVLAALVEPLRVLGVDARPDLAQEPQEALAGVALERLELVAEDRREPERDRRLAQGAQQRQVHGGEPLPEPLLAERPGAEALHVRHVAVQHHGELAPVAPARRTHRSTATKSSARSSGSRLSAKSRSLMTGMNQS